MIQHINAVKFFDKLILTELSQLDIQCWVAGGAVKNYFMGITDPNSDVDLFFKTSMDYDKCKRYMESKGGKVIWDSSNGTKISYKGNVYDLVKKYFKTPNECIIQFDFTVVMFAVGQNMVFHGKTSFMDLAKRELVFNNMQNPASTLTRCFKYYNKGFHLSNRSMKLLIKAVHETPIDASVYNVSEDDSSGAGLIVNVSISSPTPTIAVPIVNPFLSSNIPF